MSLRLFVVYFEEFLEKREKFFVVSVVIVNILDNQVDLTCFFEEL